jgi:hypothetical protein
MTAPEPPDEFMQSLQAEDELGLVVRAHIHIESKLIELLSLLADTKALERMELDYFQRVHLAVALGLREEHSKGLLALGTLRNAFAHRLGSSLTEARIRNLYAALSATDKTTVQGAYVRTERSLNQHGGKKFQSLSPRDRFVLIAVALQSILLLAIREAKHRGKSA